MTGGPETSLEQALRDAKAEARVLKDQLQQARADLHRLGIADQNRALVCGAVSGGLGLLVGMGIGLHFARRS